MDKKKRESNTGVYVIRHLFIIPMSLAWEQRHSCLPDVPAFEVSKLKKICEGKKMF